MNKSLLLSTFEEVESGSSYSLDGLGVICLKFGRVFFISLVDILDV